MIAVAWTGTALVAFWVAAYVAYSIGGVPMLREPILRFRAAGIALGMFAVLFGTMIAWLAGRALLEMLVPLLLALGLAAYAWRRQWLRPPSAPQLVATDRTLAADGLVAVLESGDAVPLQWLARLRVARVGAELVVHCALARSLSAFAAPEAAVAAILPHSSGFILSDGYRRWDGVDGRGLDAGAPLGRHTIGLARYAQWRAKFPNSALYVPPGAAALPPEIMRTVLVPGARGVDAPMAWGCVESDEWRPVSPDASLDPPQASGRYYLSHWAACRRAREALLHVAATPPISTSPDTVV